jgi:hypothetical protein
VHHLVVASHHTKLVSAALLVEWQALLHCCRLLEYLIPTAVSNPPESTFFISTLWCLQSTAALPFGTIVIILIIWGLVTIPLTVAGGIAGKNNRTDFAAPCRTNKYPREIPELPWYRWVEYLVQKSGEWLCNGICRPFWLPFTSLV